MFPTPATRRPSTSKSRTARRSPRVTEYSAGNHRAYYISYMPEYQSGSAADATQWLYDAIVCAFSVTPAPCGSVLMVTVRRTQPRDDRIAAAGKRNSRACKRSTLWSGRAPPLSRERQKKIGVRLIPYYAWSNRGPSEMSVWLPVK